jgi:ribosomal protein L11 methyltransferase
MEQIRGLDSLCENRVNTCVNLSNEESGSIYDSGVVDAEDLGSWEIHVEAKGDEDWHKTWKDCFRGFPVGQRLFVKPCWEETRGEAVKGRAVLELEVGGSFGTGDHASTLLCLEWLEGYVRSPMTLLDIGCGSGILFIAALLLGADKAYAVDIDPRAVDEAVRNAHLNALEPWRYRVAQTDILSGQPQVAMDFLGTQGADLVVANVTADVIMSIAGLVKGLIKPGGVFLVSGIVDIRWPEVQDCLRDQGFVLSQCVQKQGWVAAAARYEG